MSTIDLSVLIVTYNSEKVVRACLESVFNSIQGITVEVILVDNNSQDRTAELVEREFSWVTLMRSPRNLGFAAGNEVGFRAARGKVICLVNPDTVITDRNTFTAALAILGERPDVGIATCRLCNPDGSVQDSVRNFPHPINFVVRGLRLENLFPRMKQKYILQSLPSDRITEIDWCIGAFLLLKREMIEQIGFLDTRYFMYYEDADICARAWKFGWKVVYVPGITVTHVYKRQSAGRLNSPLTLIHLKSFIRFYLRHGRLASSRRRSEIVRMPA
jgi:GT2 family glycosyltransferase